MRRGFIKIGPYKAIGSVCTALFILFLVTTDAFAVFKRACDSFIFLVDESDSMHEFYNGKRKIEIEKETLNLINSSVPKGVVYHAVLRSFSHEYQYPRTYQTHLYFPPERYNYQKMASAISLIKAGRAWTTLGYGLQATDADIAKLPGKVHIIIFSDGKENSDYTPPEKVAKTLKEKYKDRLCIFAVQIGDDETGEEVLEGVVQASQCGERVSADDLENPKTLAAFVKKVFGYEYKQVTDADGDGVPDNKDQCPDTPKGAPVDAHGCWRIKPILFPFDKDLIQPTYFPELDEIATVLKKNPSIKLQIQGHTDSKGSETYNLILSKKRALAVKNYLVKKQVDPDRLVIKAFGESKPVADNSTEEGRKLNRRVDFVILK